MEKSATGLWTLLVLFLPAVVMALFYLYMTSVSDIKIAFTLLHIATLVWVILFFRHQPCRVSVLPVSFLLSIAAPLLIDKLRPGMFQYLGSAFVSVLYALPWSLITLIASVAALIIQRRK